MAKKAKFRSVVIDLPKSHFDLTNSTFLSETPSSQTQFHPVFQLFRIICLIYQIVGSEVLNHIGGAGKNCSK